MQQQLRLIHSTDQVECPCGECTLKREHPLTHRQWEILNLLAQGLTFKEVGARLHITWGTVKSHVNRPRGGILTNLDAKNTVHAVAIAFRKGLLS